MNFNSITILLKHPLQSQVTFFQAALILAVGIAAYGPALRGGFIWDDDVLVTENPLVRASDGLQRMWFSTEPADYWPMTYSVFWLQWRLWGDRPAGYHAVNLLVHLSCAFLIWRILARMNISGGWLAGLIFAVHPVNVESAAWISQLKSTLSMLFSLLSVLWFIGTDERKRAWEWYALSLAAFVLGMLSKGSVAMLPAVLLGIVWWRRKPNTSDFFKTLPFFLAAAMLVAVNVWFQTHGTGQKIRDVGWLDRLLGAGAVVWFYLYKAILPINLMFVYPQWQIDWRTLLWWGPLTGAVVLSLILWRYRNRNRWIRSVLAAWGYFCVSLVPVMGLVDVYYMKYTLVADHYQYVAIAGPIALAAAGWSRWFSREKYSAKIAAAVAVIALSTLSWKHNRVFADAETLYRHALAKNPRAWMVHNNLGTVLARKKLAQEAIEQYRHAIRLNPRFAEAYNNLGLTLAQTAGLAEAMDPFEQAVRIKPDYLEARMNLGAALMSAGRWEEAAQHYRKATELRPGYAQAHNSLGLALLRAGQAVQAIESFQRALQIDANYTEACMNLSLAYAAAGQREQALASAQRALDMARAHRQIEMARQFETWLSNYRGR